MVTPRIWVSPRSNSAEPCTRGSTRTCALSGRMSASPRPSMRTLSLSTRWRTSFLVSDRNAADSSFSRPSKSAASLSTVAALTASVASSRSCLPAMVSACASSSDGSGLDRGERVVLVVGEDRELAGRLATACAASSACASTSVLMNALEASRPSATISSVGACTPAATFVEGARGGLGLDHHDRDVTGVGDPAGDHHVEDGVLELGVGRERHPLALDQGDADAADRAGERQARRAGSTSTRR